MSFYIIRIVFLLVTSAIGGVIALKTLSSLAWTGMLVGLGVGLGAVGLELILRRAPVRSLVGGSLGLVAGLLLAHVVTSSLALLPFEEPAVSVALRALPAVALGYVGLLFGVRQAQRFDLARIRAAFSTTKGDPYVKILDTSAIIDGRIADVAEAGFLDGTLVVPQFVLGELQHVADSSDSLKRARGRRGLDILHKMQKMTGIAVRIVEDDFPKVREVDQKLILLARQRGAKIVTNDFNLNKVAEVQGVPVLNMNELSNAVKPLVLPGEGLRVFVLKEGKEISQGVAYLDDGTMVVVENGRKMIGRTVDVTVTSVLQTTAGRMIFGRVREEEVRDRETREKEEAPLAAKG